jgi:cytochrome c
MDESPGHETSDAQRTSGNTNDLRGKILRIHPEDDGSYTIPEGNLFPVGMEKTRPEIYVMGCRQCYRIWIDPLTDWLVFGEVGIDAFEADPTRGPRGYDEFNLAQEAGFFGWPYFGGNNEPYYKNGVPFDPEIPLNDSPNNTGLSVLPPAKGAHLWYAPDGHDEYPGFAIRQRQKCAMAGLIYNYDSHLESESKLPPHLDGKWLVHDWSQGWIKVLELSSDGKEVTNVYPIFENMEFSFPMDMDIGPEGALYLLEYGPTWDGFSPQASLSRIEYTGSCLPVSVATETTPANGPEQSYSLVNLKLNRNVKLDPESAGIELYSLQGKKVWEYVRSNTCRSDRVSVPSEIGNPLLLRKIIPNNHKNPE